MVFRNPHSSPEDWLKRTFVEIIVTIVTVIIVFVDDPITDNTSGRTGFLINEVESWDVASVAPTTLLNWFWSNFIVKTSSSSPANGLDIVRFINKVDESENSARTV